MIENWIDFAVNVVGGATAFLCLFDGTRRLCAFGVHRKAVLMTVLAAGICALYGAFAYWKYTDLKATLSVNQRKAAATQPPPNWGKGLSPEKKEVLSLARARQAFMESGTLASYVDRGGETRTFAPTQEDLMRRERVVTYYSRAEDRKSTRLNPSHLVISYAVFCLKKKKIYSNRPLKRPSISKSCSIITPNTCRIDPNQSIIFAHAHSPPSSTDRLASHTEVRHAKST